MLSVKCGISLNNVRIKSLQHFLYRSQQKGTTTRSHPEMSSEIGIYGLTAQGIQLALNMASKDCLVTVGNKSSDKVRSMLLSA